MALVARPKDRRRVLLALWGCSIAVHQGIAQYARDADWILDDAFLRDRVLMPGWHGDGVIAGFGVVSETDQTLLRLNVPKVSVGSGQVSGMSSVSVDGEAVGRVAAEHFLERGFNNFAFYLSSRLPGELQRLQGYENAIKAAGGRLQLIDLGSARGANRIDYIAGRLEEFSKPLAVFADSDDRAIEVMDAAISRQVRIPEQVAVLGVNNDELRCPFATVPLSSVDIDEERVGFEAAHLLDQAMAGQGLATEAMLIAPRAVVTRQSTNIRAIAHEDVALALRLIWEHYREPIDAMQIAEQVPLSYPQLHAQFVRYVGHSMAHEIMVRRLEHARTLLTGTEARITDVARQSGFGSADRLGRVFMRELKMTPSEFRERHTLREAAARLETRQQP